MRRREFLAASAAAIGFGSKSLAAASIAGPAPPDAACAPPAPGYIGPLPLVRATNDRNAELQPATWDDGLPWRGHQCRACTHQEREQQQQERSGQIKPDEHGENRGNNRRRDLYGDEEPAPIDHVRKHASREDQETHRQHVRYLNQGHGQRCWIEARHKPSGCRVVHPGADIRDDCRSPQHGEGGATERAPSRARHVRGGVARGPGDSLLPHRLFYHPYAT